MSDILYIEDDNGVLFANCSKKKMLSYKKNIYNI